MGFTEASRVRVTGPLAGFAAGFCEELAAQGFTDWSATAQLRLMAHVSGWLADQGLDANSFTSERVDEFVAARRQQGYTRRLTSRALAPLLDHLRSLGAVPPPRPIERTDVERLVDRYRDYLLIVRGLTVGTVGLYTDVASRFLAEHTWGVEDLKCLEPGDVTQFVLCESQQRSVASAKNMVTGLRSFLRFLFTDGLTSRRLDDAVPSVAGWHLSSLPLALAADEIGRLVRSCDRGCAVGRRDYAILCCCPVWVSERARSLALRLWTSTGATQRSSCAARADARSGSHCPWMSARHSSPTCVTAGPAALARRCSNVSVHHTAH